MATDLERGYFKLPRGTAARLQQLTVVLPAGVLVAATDTGQLFLHDGVTPQNQLTAIVDPAAQAAAITTAVTNAVNALVAGAPGALNTLKELADALGDDPNYATTVATALANRLPLWQPNTAYTAGKSVLSPAGDVVTAKTGFTSGASFVASNWNLAGASASLGTYRPRAAFATPTTVASSTLSAGTFEQVDATGGSLTRLLAAGTTVDDEITVKVYALTSPNTVTVQGAPGVTAPVIPLVAVNQSITLKWTGSAWVVSGRDNPKAYLDSVYTVRKTQMRTLEDYSTATLVSGVTDCTAAINAALADSDNIGVPLQLLGKTYLTTGGHKIPSYLKMVGIQGPGSRSGGSLIRLTGGNSVNLFQSASWGDPTVIDQGITLQDLCLDGGLNAQAEASPHTYLMVDAPLSTSGSTITVQDTTGFPASGLIWVGLCLVSYSGLTGTSFTGCVTVAGQGAVTMKANAWVTLHASLGHCLALQAALCSLTNVSLTFARGSNLMIQGTPTNIAYQNSGVNCQFATSNRFALELGEMATDNNFVAPILGDHNGRGNVIIRADDNMLVGPHLVGSMAPMDASLIICANDARILSPIFDTIPFTGIRLNTAVRGGIQVADPVITDIDSVYHNAAGANHTTFLAGAGSQSELRGKITGYPSTASATRSPYFNGYRSAFTAVLVGDQNPTTISTANGGTGLLQLDSVADFPPAPTGTQTITVGSDTCTYTGRSKALNRTSAAAAANATTLTITKQSIPGGAAFAAGGGTVLIGPGTAGLTGGLSMTVTYTSYSAATGVFSGCSGITAAVPVGAYVTQSFLTGVTGASSNTVAANGSQVAMPSQGFVLSGIKFDWDFGVTLSSVYAPNLNDIYSIYTASLDSGLAYPSSFDPVLASGTYTSAANLTRYIRVRDGGRISKIRVNVVASGGNICVGVYRNQGTGVNAVPITRIATSGSVATPGTGDQDIALTNVATVQPGDWLAVSADNATVQLVSSANASAVSSVGAGRHYQQTGTFPLPTTPSSLSAVRGTAPLLIGVV